MFQRPGELWSGLGKMDIVLALMSCVAIVAVYAAFIM
jgi:hypothetical protein